MVLVDTSVILDVLSDDSQWRAWSKSQLISASRHGGLAVNDVVYAELSIGYDDPAELEAMLVEWQLQLRQIPTMALFQAGKAFKRYRLSKGTKTGVLPRLLRWRACGGRRLASAHAGRGAHQNLFPAVALIAP